MSESNQGQKTQSRFRLTPMQPAAKSLPSGGPVDGSELVNPATGARLAPIAAGTLAFNNQLSFGNLASLRLRTTGFEEVESSGTDIEIAPLEEGVPAPPIPAPATELLEIALKPAAPGAAKLMGGPGSLPLPTHAIMLPEAALQTLRRKMKLGRDPKAPVASVTQEVKAEPDAVKPAAMTVKPPAPSAPKPGPTVVKPAAAAVKPEVTPPARKPAPPAEKPKVTVKPPQPVAAPPVEKKQEPARPAIAARDHGNAVPAERPAAREETPAPKPKLMPARKPEPVVPESKPAEIKPGAAAMDDAPVFSMGAEQSGGSSKAKIGIIAAALVVVAGVGSLMFSGKKDGSSTRAGSAPSATSSGMAIGGGGWSTNWGNEAPINKEKQISIYRPSASLTDYRFEFRGQIERKAMGWIFRAANPKNYYVAKLEVVKPGLNPVVALVKYAVTNGKEGTHTQVLLPPEIKPRLDTIYGVRMDVKGSTFTTYVQDKLVDVWSDEQVKTGGVGFHTEKGERAAIKSSQVAHLSSGN